MIISKAINTPYLVHRYSFFW